MMLLMAAATSLFVQWEVQMSQLETLGLNGEDEFGVGSEVANWACA